MSIQVTFTVDENFTEYDLKQVIAYKDLAIALHNITYHIYRMERGKLEHPESAYDLLEQLVLFIKEEMSDLPELD